MAKSIVPGTYKQSIFLWIFLTTAFLLTPVLAWAQEGIVSSVYMAERTALQKMWKAREAGNEEEVTRLSGEIQEMVKQKKSWATDLLTLTRSSIDKAQNENAPDLTPEQRLLISDKIDQLNSDLRLAELALEENHLQFLGTNGNDREMVKVWQANIDGILQYARERTAELEKIIKDEEGNIAGIKQSYQKELGNVEQRLEAANKDYENACKREGKQDFSQRAVDDCKAMVSLHTETIGKMKQEIADGTRLSNGQSVKAVEDVIAIRRQEVASIAADVATGIFRHRYGGQYGTPTINECKEVIERLQKEIEKRREQYAAEEFNGRKDLRQQRENLHIEILKLQEQVGLKDEKVAALIARKNELETFLYHDFITEIPKEDSGFMKAIKWLGEALEKVNEVTEKFERIRKLTSLVRAASNPLEAVNYILKEATGTNLTERIAQKLLPDKMLQNALVQRMLKGEPVNREDILKEAVFESLPENTRRQVEQAVDVISTMRSSNIRDVIKSRGFEEAMKVVDADPALKKAWDTFQQANQLVNNPGLIEDRLKAVVTEKVKLEMQTAGKQLVDKIIDEEVGKRINEYQQKIEKIQDDIRERKVDVAEKLTESAVQTFEKALEYAVGKTEENNSATEDMVKNYPAR
ncbi:MAG: hypothetical protein KKB51_18965 [Candidatus Riflebacteria bacterium]|nr:hypothetical protein [Candidatus Riflebacteria bacterium]